MEQQDTFVKRTPVEAGRGENDHRVTCPYRQGVRAKSP